MRTLLVLFALLLIPVPARAQLIEDTRRGARQPSQAAEYPPPSDTLTAQATVRRPAHCGPLTELVMGPLAGVSTGWFVRFAITVFITGVEAPHRLQEVPYERIGAIAGAGLGIASAVHCARTGDSLMRPRRR